MRFLRLIIISIISFLLLVTIFSLFVPSRLRVSRATNLAPGAENALSKISDLEQWKNWYPQFDQIILQEPLYEGGRLVQATANGIKLAVTAVSDSFVTVQMNKGSRPVISHWKLIRHGSGDSLTLQNFIDFDLRWYPWEKFSGLMLDGSYGPPMEQGLQKLKVITADE